MLKVINILSSNWILKKESTFDTLLFINMLRNDYFLKKS